MPGRRVLALLFILYLGSDLAVAWLPGVFFLGNDGLFIETVVEGQAKPARPFTAPVPRMTVTSSALASRPRVLDPAVASSAWRVPVPRHAVVRSSPSPSSLDDH